MVDVLNMPAVANDIRLSTLEPVQQLGARLAHVFSAELSRLRADAAFALSTGVTLQTVAADGDRIRAEQLSSIHSRLVSLETQAMDASRASQEWRDRRVTQNDEDSSEHPASNSNSAPDVSGHESLMLALSQALHSVHAVATEEGVSGHPVACVLPLDTMLAIYDDFAPIRKDEAVDDSCLLILCLAFDGSLGESRRLWGFAYRQDQLLGQLGGYWNRRDEHPMASLETSEDTWQVTVSDVHQDVSVLQCGRSDHHYRGYRVRQQANSDEPAEWYWRAGSWAWL